MIKNYTSTKSSSDKGFRMFAVLFAAVTAMTFTTAVFNKAIAVPPPSTSFSTTNPAVPAASICQGGLKYPVYAFDLTVASGPVTLTGCNFTTAGGTYVATDVVKFQLWYSATTLAAATQVGSDITTTLGNGLHTFTIGTPPSLATGLWHLWITIDVAAAAGVGNTIIVSAMTNTNITLGSGSKSGNGFAMGTQTIVAKPFITTQPTSPIAGCVGSSIFLTGMVSGGQAATWQWQYGAGGNVTNGNPAGVNYTNPTSAVLQIDGLTAGTYTYKCVVSGFCPPTVTSNTVTVNVSNTNAVNVTVNAVAPSPFTGLGPFVLCGATTYYFTATPTNGGTAPTYAWFLNGSPVGTNSPNYNGAVNPGDFVYCNMTYGGTGVTCPSPPSSPVTSNTVMFNPACAVSTTPSGSGALSPRCTGAGSNTYTLAAISDPCLATSGNVYEWSCSNPAATITTWPQYTTTPTLTINWQPAWVGAVTIKIRGLNPCGAAGPWGNNRGITTYALTTQTSSITPDMSRFGLNGGVYWDTICHHTANVTFQNSPLTYPSGVATYEWYWNGVLSQTGPSNSFTTNNFNDLDSIYLRVVPAWTPAPTQCYNPAPFISNIYHMKVLDDSPPTVTSLTASPNPACIGQNVTLTATVGSAGLGSSPTYTWYDNGNPIGRH